MTIVCSSLAETAGLTALSDILLSQPDRGSEHHVILPLRPRPIAYAKAGNALAGVAQKMVLLTDRTMFLWAGPMVVARAAIMHAAEISGGGKERINLSEALSTSGLSSEELSRVALICHQVLEGRIWVQCHNAERAKLGPAEVAYSGSGSFHFVEDTMIRREKGGPYEPTETVDHWLACAIEAMIREVLCHENYDYMYGGWMEIEHSYPQHFRKLPYAVKFWRRKGDQLQVGGLPLFFSWYHGHDLMICSIAMIPADNDIKMIRVPDLLGRTKRPFSKRKLPWKPEFIWHVVLAEDNSVFAYREKGSLTEMKVERNGNFSARFHPELLQRLANVGRADGQPIHDFSRASEKP